jgi:hypothetical protein
VSRDLTSAEWVENLVGPRERELEELKRHLSYVRQRAYYEGLTHHLRPGVQGTPFHECPFCSAEEVDLHGHLITCEDVPPELRGE